VKGINHIGNGRHDGMTFVVKAKMSEYNKDNQYHLEVVEEVIS